MYFHHPGGICENGRAAAVPTVRRFLLLLQLEESRDDAEHPEASRGAAPRGKWRKPRRKLGGKSWRAAWTTE